MARYLLLLVLFLPGCALTGNVGPVVLKCEEDGRKLELTLPSGSGRVFKSINGQESPCGVVLDGVQQGEDRSGGLFSLLAAFFVG